jgi:hypothetical protein
LKRRVVKPVRNYLGIDFLKVLNCNHRALRLHVQPVVEALEGKWGSQGTAEQRRGTLHGVGQACGE